MRYNWYVLVLIDFSCVIFVAFTLHYVVLTPFLGVSCFDQWVFLWKIDQTASCLLGVFSLSQRTLLIHVYILEVLYIYLFLYTPPSPKKNKINKNKNPAEILFTGRFYYFSFSILEISHVCIKSFHHATSQQFPSAVFQHVVGTPSDYFTKTLKRKPHRQW